MNDLAMAHYDAGRLDMAISVLEQTLEKRRKTLGDEHVETIETMNDLASLTGKQARPRRRFRSTRQRS